MQLKLRIFNTKMWQKEDQSKELLEVGHEQGSV